MCGVQLAKVDRCLSCCRKSQIQAPYPPKKKQEVVSVYSSIYCKQIDALLATKRIALISDCFCNMRGCGASGA